MIFIFCFFKQKTAYEMRISDWSSDVCSSDLTREHTLMRRGHAFPESRRSKSTEDLMTARILLVEDDPTTCAFLAAAARGVPAEVDVAGSCAAALALAGEIGRAHV